jgi:hypothetical protein
LLPAPLQGQDTKDPKYLIAIKLFEGILASLQGGKGQYCPEWVISLHWFLLHLNWPHAGTQVPIECFWEVAKLYFLHHKAQ